MRGRNWWVIRDGEWWLTQFTVNASGECDIRWQTDRRKRLRFGTRNYARGVALIAKGVLVRIGRKP